MRTLCVPVMSCPSLIRDFADNFKDLLTASNYRSFVALLCGNIFGIIGCSNIFRFLMFSPSVSSLDNFLNYDIYESLNRRHRRRLLSILKKVESDRKRYCYAIDDTFLEHYGKNIWGTYWWNDHGKKSIFGHKLLVIGLVDRKHNILIPLIWEVLHREDSDTNNQQHKKAWEIALKLLQNLNDLGYEKFNIVADSWFCCEEFFSILSEKNYDFCVEFKRNRKVVRYGFKSFNMRLDVFFKNRFMRKIYHNKKVKLACEAILWLKDAKERPYKICAIANKNSGDKEPFAYYGSNKLTWDATKLWGLSRDRWTIEVQFRDLKQFFTLGEAAVRSKQAVETTISLSAIALTVIRLQQIEKAESHKIDNRYTRPIPAGDIIRKLQLTSIFQSISKLATDDAKREKVIGRLNDANFCQKPADFRKEKIKENDNGLVSFLKNLAESAAEKFWGKQMPII
jgi:hypothetical protein